MEGTHMHVERRIDEIRKTIEDKTHWAKLRDRVDEQTDEQYIDILVGVKGEEEPHAHMGINLDQTIRFNCPRKVTHSISRVVETVKKGHIESKKIIVDPDVVPGKALVFRLDTNAASGKTTLEECRLE